MENASWFDSYLAPLGLSGQPQQGDLKQQLGQKQRLSAAGSRSALTDITNNAAARGDVGKVSNRSQEMVKTGGCCCLSDADFILFWQASKATKLAVPQQPELSQQTFTNPDYIDGAHAGK
jgi:hypothetical protein